VVEFPWARHDSWFSRDFEDLVVFDAISSNKLAVGRRYEVSWRAVDHMCVRVATEALGRIDLLSGLVAIAIDEVRHKKGQRYLTVVCDHLTGRVIWAQKGRTKDTVNSFFDALGVEQAAELQFVTCDGAEWIRSVVAKRSPGALICLDTFHPSCSSRARRGVTAAASACIASAQILVELQPNAIPAVLRLVRAAVGPIVGEEGSWDVQPVERTHVAAKSSVSSRVAVTGSDGACRLHRRRQFRATRGHVRVTPLKIVLLTLVTLAVNLVMADAAGAAIVTSEASLVSGQLTIVGSGAVPHSGVTVDDGPLFGLADAKGDFTITASDFSEPSCVATLDDGSVTVEVTLSGCTPTISPPPPPPPPPSVTGPAPGASTTEPVTLSWQPPVSSPGVSFRWQVSSKPRFAPLVLTATTDPRIKSAVLSGLTPGTYFWRVQSVESPPELYNTMHGDWTSWRKLVITGVAPGTPGTPAFLAPQPGAAYHPTETFHLSWTATTDSTSYLLQMARKADFAPGALLIDVVEHSTVASAPLFEFQTPLFVRVFGVNAQGVLSVPSTTLPLRITYKAPIPAAPTLVSPADKATVTLPVTLDWSPDPNPQVEGYELEINSNPNFSGGCGDIEECVTGLSQPQDTLFSLPSGVHFWRVQSSHGLAGPDRGAVTAWSAARSFTVSGAPPQVEGLTIDVYTGGGTFLRSHTHVFSGANEDNEAFGIVQLTTPAPAGGTTIALATSNPKAAAVPPSIAIPAGQAQGSFTIQPLQVARPATLSLSATLAGLAVTAPLTVDPASLNQVFIESNEQEDGKYVPNFISGGTDVVSTVLFNGNAPNRSLITMASNSPAASVPASVTATGQLVSFTLTTRPVTTSTPVVLTATWRARTVSVKLTLQPPPTLIAPAPGVSFADGRVVILRWHTPTGLSSQLQVADNPAFTNPIVDFDTDTSQAQALMSLPDGRLYWRVLGVDIYGNEGPPPAARTFTVRPPTGPLPAPVLNLPENGATVTAGQQVNFLWQVVHGAFSYELQVSASSTFDPPLVLDNTLTTHELDTAKLPVGALFWRVRAIDSNGQGPWSPVFQLTVASG
jgi:hypothetical protein